MLAQNFKTAEELGLHQDEWDALTKVLVMLETEQIQHAPKITGLLPGGRFCNERPAPTMFNMAFMLCETDCGTAGCLGGWARYVANDKKMFLRNIPEALSVLFLMGPMSGRPTEYSPESITPSEAATALRSYLTTGKANWAEAMS